MTWGEEAGRRLEGLDALGRRRAVRTFDARGPRGKIAGRAEEIVSFASNDYLGLTQHPDVIAAAHDAVDMWGAGSGSARLIVGGRPIHEKLENELAAWKRTERALLFPNGYAANLGVLATFGTPDTLICSDELNHASIVDGCRMARGRVAVYPHGDVDAVDALLRTERRAIVVTDSVFSMDGDAAPVEDLTEVCDRHGALLVLDEAHAVLGPHTGESAAERVKVGTLSKFLGASGGFVAGDAPLVDLLLNEARSFIFTTAGTPADAAAALAALRVLRSAEGELLKERLRSLIDIVRPAHPSPIVPVVVGSDRDALAASDALLERGYLVPAIRPPSVPQGSARLRVTLSAAHTDEEVQGLVKALGEVLDG